MNNILYCFDENYNIQGFCSIISLLNQSKEEKSIYIIHQDPESFKRYKKIILQHKKLRDLSIYKFKKGSIKFPNLYDKHVSEATYYRLFIDRYLPSDIDYIFYVDADAFFINSFEFKLNDEKLKLDKSPYTISVLSSNSHDNYSRLNLQNDKYFNAGVMLINYKRWLKNKSTTDLLHILENTKLNLEFWDQDILNMYFDGEYQELPLTLNYNVYGDQQSSHKVVDTIKGQATIIHFSGKHKPWSPKGIFSIESEFYSQIYRELFKEKYHIVSAWSVNTLRILFKNLLNLNIFRIKYPFGYIFLCLKAVLEKNKNSRRLKDSRE